MQSQIIFDDNANKSPSWILLPREPYMGILSKKDRIAMSTLQQLPVTHNGK